MPCHVIDTGHGHGQASTADPSLSSHYSAPDYCVVAASRLMDSVNERPTVEKKYLPTATLADGCDRVEVTRPCGELRTHLVC